MNSIRRKLNPLRKPWAVSGSMAMKMHANKAGVPVHRKPNDIDIVVRPKDFELFVMQLAGLGYTFKGPPPINYEKTRHLKLYKGSNSIDLLQAGSNLAPNIRMNNINIFNKTPVVKLRHLIYQKKSTLNNFENAKARSNYNFLMKLVRD
jgi:hypothetical protein